MRNIILPQLRHMLQPCNLNKKENANPQLHDQHNCRIYSFQNLPNHWIEFQTESEKDLTMFFKRDKKKKNAPGFNARIRGMLKKLTSEPINLAPRCWMMDHGDAANRVRDKGAWFDDDVNELSDLSPSQRQHIGGDDDGDEKAAASQRDRESRRQRRTRIVYGPTATLDESRRFNFF